MTTEQAIKILNGAIKKPNTIDGYLGQALTMAIAALNCSEIPNSSDTISRQAAIDAVDKRFDGIPMEQTQEILLLRRDLRTLPSAQPEQKWETCFDCPLSHGCPKINGCTNGQAMEYASKVPDDCPISVQPRKGKWIGYNADDKDWQRDDGSPIFMNCSECHEAVINNGSAHWNFCPNCGADMREG